MKELDAYKFRTEIELFKNTIAPTARQSAYLEDSKERIKDEIGRDSDKSGQSIERCMLVAICGELHSGSSKKEQAEFATRLLLLDLLTEQV